MEPAKSFVMPRLGEILLVTHSDVHSNGSKVAPAIVTRVWSFDCVNLSAWPDCGEPHVLMSVCHLSRGILDPKDEPCGWFREEE